jgi:predicted nucleic acid-binding protein
VALWYLDTSALAKLVLEESGSAAMRDWAAERIGGVFTSMLARVELERAVALRAPDAVASARALLDSLFVLRFDRAIIDHAARIDPPALRSLDALHLASALSLDEDLHGMVTYDRHLADAARANGVQVAAPT